MTLEHQYQYQQALYRAQAMGKAPLSPSFGSAGSQVPGGNVMFGGSGGQSPYSALSPIPLSPLSGATPTDQMQMMAAMYQQYQLQLYLYQLQQAQAGSPAATPPPITQPNPSPSPSTPQLPTSTAQYASLFGGHSGLNSSYPAQLFSPASQPSGSSTLFSSSSLSSRRRDGLPPPNPAQAYPLFSHPSHPQSLAAELGASAYRFEEEKLTLQSLNHDAT